MVTVGGVVESAVIVPSNRPASGEFLFVEIAEVFEESGF